MKTIQILSISILFSMVLFSSCKDEKKKDDPVKTVTYTSDIKTILNTSCAITGCHPSGSKVGSMADYADAKAFAEIGRILGCIKHQADFSPMPKNADKLSDEKIALIEKWVTDGLKE